MSEYSWHIPDPHTQREFYADVPLKRLLAWGIDTVIIVVISILVLPFTAFAGIFFFPLLMLSVGLPYRIITIARGSATFGMRLMAIELRTLRGERFDLSMAASHTLIFTACSMIFPAQIVSMILIATTERAQGLPDFALGSVAINRRAGA